MAALTAKAAKRGDCLRVSLEKEELADLKEKELQEREAKVAEREARCEEREAEMALSDKAAAAVNAALAEQVAAIAYTMTATISEVQVSTSMGTLTYRMCCRASSRIS